MARRQRDARGRFKKTSSRRRSPARKRARSTTRRRRTYRRNPKFRPIETLMEGAQGALGAVVGKAAARAIPQQFGIPTSGPLGIATQAAVALALGMAADRIAPRWVAFVIAGALMGPIESTVSQLGIPVLSPALSAYPGMPRLPSGMSGGGSVGSGAAYAGVSAYPHGSQWDPMLGYDA